MAKIIKWSAAFTHAYVQRIAHNEALKTEFFASLEALQADPALVSAHPLTHKMTGRWGFWLNQAYRVIYRERETAILLLAIGTHAPVKLKNGIRLMVETVNAQLQEQFSLSKHYAKTQWGAVTRIAAKVTAHTLGLFINQMLGRPRLALVDLAR